MDLAVEFVAGLGFLIIGLSCLFRTDDWMSWLHNVQMQGRKKVLALGSIGLLLSALIVAVHPVWTGLPVLLTLIGIFGILESTLYLLYPGAMTSILSFYEPRYKIVIRAFSLIMILFGSIILYSWVQQTNFVYSDDGPRYIKEQAPEHRQTTLRQI